MMTREQLAEEFRRIGIRSGDVVVLHSSFKSLGGVEGGAVVVSRAMRDVLGPSGTLLMPTFTYSLPMWNQPPYDARKSPSRVGAVTEAFRSESDVVRSNHPTHSVAAAGRLAEDLTRGHREATALGSDSPFGRAYRLGAKILMLGCDQISNSSIHLCEVLANLPYNSVAFTPKQNYENAWFINESRQTQVYRLFEIPGCSRGFGKTEPWLEKLGLMRRVKVGPAKSQLMDARSFVDGLVAELKRRPDWLLCEESDCVICPARRKVLH
ncbi:MAG: AAC(3) family N-acetyltransferase [bacterium]